MNEQQTGIVVKWVGANWPAAPMNADTVEVFILELSRLGFDETLAVLRESFADAAFPPTPMQLRNAVLRPELPDVGSLIDELLDRIAAVGYMNPEPAWSHPIIGEWVHRRGGWAETCKSTPARATADVQGASVFNTWRAQTRDDLRVLAARADRELIHSALSAGSVPALEMPDLRYGDQ